MRSLLRLLIWTGLLAASLVGLARITAIRWWRVPLDDPWLVASVAPTLKGGDWVVLWRLTRPRQGDLVLCPEPKAAERVVVGRVFGTANDEVDSSGGSLRLNGRIPAKEGSCPEVHAQHPKSGTPIELACSLENLEGHVHLRADSRTEAAAPPSANRPVTVEPGQFFLASDNRQIYFDSRDYGAVPAESCQETFVFRLWSKEGYFNPSGRFEILR